MFIKYSFLKKKERLDNERSTAEDENITLSSFKREKLAAVVFAAMKN